MTTQTIAIPASLLDIERELSQPGLGIRFRNGVLERSYRDEHNRAARLHNRIVACIMTVIFDCFIIPEIHTSPEILHLSVILRLGVFTPAVLAYVLLDWRGLINRWVPAIVTILLIAPTAIASLMSISVVSPTALTNNAAIPVILIAIIAARVSLLQALTVGSVSCLIYIYSVLSEHFLPPGVAPSLILTDLGFATGALVFSWRLDLRDRKVFLFTQQATIGREILAAQNRMLARLSQVDALTGLGNRRCFDETMAALWTAALAKPSIVSLILFDIDCFKQFNDALGHQAGDECLGAIARTVTHCLRDEHDTIVRYGGEEFAIILPDTSLEAACTLAERVRLAVVDRALPHPGGGPHHLVTISLGVAAVSPPLQSSSSLVEEADQLLYLAKRDGRNRVVGERRARLRVVK